LENDCVTIKYSIEFSSESRITLVSSQQYASTFLFMFGPNKYCKHWALFEHWTIVIHGYLKIMTAANLKMKIPCTLRFSSYSGLWVQIFFKEKFFF